MKQKNDHDHGFGINFTRSDREEDKSALGAFVHPKVHAIFMFIFGTGYLIKAYMGQDTTTFGWIYFTGMVFFALLICARGVYELFKK